MKTLLLLLGAILVLATNDVAGLPKDQQQLILRGRVVFPKGSRIPIEAGGILTVELQDTSLADAPAKVIAKSTGQAIRFPMAFAIKYKPDQVKGGISYSLHVSIRNKKNELLYTNDVHTGVIPLGAERTKLIDVPVILVKKPVTKPPKAKWSNLVGMKGTEAIEIIKKETGFTNVVTIREGSPVTMDYRTDRVRVFVNGKGIVTSVPMIA